MSDSPLAAIGRILLVHPDASARQAIAELLRQAGDGALTVYEADAPAAGLEASRALDPRVVLLDLGGDRRLALDVARELRGARRRVVGLYNPLLLAASETEAFFRRASRAGVGDFVPLPAGADELAAALDAAGAAVGAEGEPERGRLVAFLSPKGGVGTTTLAACTALVLSGSGEVDGEVALCDAAVPFGSAAALLGLTPSRDLADLARDLEDLKALGSYLAEEERTHLAVLAAPRDPYDAQRLTPGELSRVLIQLRRRFARVVVDAPPGLDLLSLAAVDLAERLYVVTEATLPTVVATRSFLRLLEEQGLGGERLRVVLNRVGGDGRFEPELVEERLERAVDLRVPFDPEVVSEANRGEPPVIGRPDSPFSEAVGAIAEEVLAGRPA